MWVLLPDGTLGFTNYSSPYREVIWPWIEKMGGEIRLGTDVGLDPEFMRTYYNVQTPIRVMEYSFALQCVQSLQRSKQIDMEGARVLDAGCGFTPFSCSIEQRFGAEVVAIDSDRAAIELMPKLSARWGRSVEWQHGDLTHLPFPDASFDVIFCISVLEHIPRGRDSQALKEMLRVLKPDGVLILTVDWGPTSFKENLFRFVRRGKSAMNAISRGRVRQTLHRAMAPKPYTTRSLLKYILGVQPESFIRSSRQSDKHLRGVTTRDIVSFWVEHSPESMPYDPRKRYYAAVGLVAAKNETHRRVLEKRIEDTAILP